MAPPSKRKKKKQVATAPSYYSDRFRTKENEDHYTSVIVNKSVIPEVVFALEEGEFPEIQAEINKRGWDLFCSPPRIIGRQRVLEFYANAWSSGRNREGGFKSYVRSVEIDFEPQNIERIFNLRTVSHDRFSTRMKGHKKLDQVLQDICIPGTSWKLDKQEHPSQLARSDLIPVAKGWLEFINHSIIPTTHHSEVTIDRAVLIHCIMTQEEIDLSDILSKGLLKFAHSSRMTLSFPGLIQRLTEAAGVVIEDDIPIVMPRPITAATLKPKRKDGGPEIPPPPPVITPEALPIFLVIQATIKIKGNKMNYNSFGQSLLSSN